MAFKFPQFVCFKVIFGTNFHQSYVKMISDIEVVFIKSQMSEDDYPIAPLAETEGKLNFLIPPHNVLKEVIFISPSLFFMQKYSFKCIFAYYFIREVVKVKFR